MPSERRAPRWQALLLDNILDFAATLPAAEPLNTGHADSLGYVHLVRWRL
jgi:hypothetical protein